MSKRVFIDCFQWHIYRNLWQSDKNKDETTQTPRNMACVRKSLSKGVQGHDRYRRQKGINTVKYNAVVSQLESRLPISFISTCLSVCFCLSLHHVKVRLRSSFQLRKEKDFMPLKWHLEACRGWDALSECFIPAILTRHWVVSFTKSMIICFNNTVPRDERNGGWLNIKWWYIQNEMVIPAIWNYDTVFRVHFALTCKNYSPGYVFKGSWLQSEGNIWTAHDHIKQHFNIPTSKWQSESTRSNHRQQKQ